MAIHDSFARLTPYELLFPTEEEAERVCGEILQEAEARSVDVGELSIFLSLAPVGGWLRSLRPDDVGGEGIHRYALLAHQAVLFHRGGRRLFLAGEEMVRRVVGNLGEGPDAAGPGAGPEPALPARAGYLQLPRHLVWIHPVAGGPPEPVDGLFWNLHGDGTLRLLAALGVREGRPGLAVSPIAEAPWSEAGSWLAVRVREAGPDFETRLPGGELEELYSLETAGEALKLFAGIWTWGAPDPTGPKEPDAVPASDAPGPAAASTLSDAPAPSRLPWTTVHPTHT
ncbi:MAG: hypothetical protein ACE5GJ_00050 [Gemmatimonadota bacterium]